jgi:hypothetical protein
LVIPRALELIIFAALPVTPFTVVVSVFAVEVFETPLTALLVDAIPLTVLVKVLPESAIVFVVVGTNPERLIAAPVTPLTVVVRLDPDKLFETEFTIATDVPVTPFTVVDKLFPDELLEIEFIIGTAVLLTPFIVVVKLLALDVFATLVTALDEVLTPLTTLVRVLPEIDNECVVEGINPDKFIAEPVIPFTVVVRLEPDKLFETEFIIGTAVAATPFTVVVKLFTEEVLEIEFTNGTAVPVTPFIVVVKLLAEELFATALTELLVDVMPFTVLVKVLPDKPNVLVVVGTKPARLIPVPETPLTVVVSVVPDKVFETPLTVLLVDTIPLTVLVKVLPDRPRVLVVVGIIPARLIAAPVTPLTVVVRLDPDKLFEIEFTIATDVPVTPLTVVDKLFPAELLEIEFTIGTAVPETPLIVVVKLFALDVLATDATALLVAVIPLTVLVNVLPDKLKEWVVVGIIPERFIAVPVTPLTVVVRVEPDKLFETEFIIGTAVAAMPLTEVVKLLPDEVFAIELIIGTAVPETPLIVVVKLFTLDELATDPTALLVAAIPFTVLVSVLPDSPKVFVVAEVKAFRLILFIFPALVIVSTLSVLAPVVRPVIFKALPAVAMVVAWLNVPPNCTSNPFKVNPLLAVVLSCITA